MALAQLATASSAEKLNRLTCALKWSGFSLSKQSECYEESNLLKLSVMSGSPRAEYGKLGDKA